MFTNYCTVYSVHYTLPTTSCTLNTAHYTMHTTHCYRENVHRTLHTLLYMLCSVCCACIRIDHANTSGQCNLINHHNTLHCCIATVLRCKIDKLILWYIATLLRWYINTLLHGYNDTLQKQITVTLQQCSGPIRWKRSLAIFSWPGRTA